MHSDFDSQVDRKGTGSLKWDRFAGRDVLPFWVADMDFKAPQVVINALQKRVAHGVFGYTIPSESLFQAAQNYQDTHYGVQVEKDWLIWFPGVVPALNVACRAFTEEDESIMVLSPNYPPFFSAPANMQRKVISVPLKDVSGRYEMDFEAMEAAVTPKTKLFLLCNPQNPVGRVYSREELEQLLDFCERHDLIICSDEIHCDLVLDADKEHVTITALGERARKRSLALMAPSKTYNIPGLCCAFITIPDRGLRIRFEKARAGLVSEVNALGYIACQAVMEDGESWRRELIAYLRANRDYIVDFLKKNLPQIKINHVEATYLAWMDPRELGLDNAKMFFEQAGVGLSDGADYGLKGFLRFNFGCPRAMLEEGLMRMKRAVDLLEQKH